MSYKLTILEITPVTHDVNKYKLEKPSGYSFEPGQATEVSINLSGWVDEKRPFTFTSLPKDDHLEFVIKSYESHHGVTDQLSKIRPGDQLILDDPWGAISYQGEGVFLAGGAGITPFISIFRMLESQGKVKGNKLIFANKTSKDVILESYFRGILGDNFVSILDEEEKEGHEHGRIDKEFLKKHVKDFSQHFYLCGPDPMVKALKKDLEELGAKTDEVIFEK
ncbi:MAG: FAD-binding oxidoreductase [Cyclobacteriaceae bacterium]|nr:FAD-binding oxidoreductase [Cyclobacteriaceae bacterium]MDX5468032.1 FAD-binding oxidoreductase [Cyclobacteriaceae bacterium]